MTNLSLPGQIADLNQAQVESNQEKESSALGVLARNLIETGKPEESLRYFDEAIKIAEENALHELKVAHIGNRGVALVKLGRFDEAREQFDKVMKLAEQVGNPLVKCDALIQRAIMHIQIPRGDLAQTDLIEALALAEDKSDLHRQMNIYGLLGHIHFDIASFDEAAVYFEKALKVVGSSNNRLAQAGYQHNLGNVYYCADLTEKAIELFLQALEIFRELEDRQGQKTVLLRLTKAYLDTNQPEQVGANARDGLLIARQLDDLDAIYAFLNVLMISSNQLGKLDDSLGYICDAMLEAERNKDTERLLNLYVSLANTNYEQNNFENARDAYLKGLELSVRLQNWELQTRILGRLSAVEAESGDFDKAYEYGQEALKIAESTGSHWLVGEQLMLLAFSARDMGRKDDALEYAAKAKTNFERTEANAALEKIENFIGELSNL